MVKKCKNPSSSSGYSFVLLGQTGSGKSAAGNTILGQKAFPSNESSVSVTQEIQVKHATVCGASVTVYDTPGFYATDHTDEVSKKCQRVIRSCDSGSDICTYLLVIKSDRFTEEERKTVQKTEQLLGEDRLKKTWILFTRGDELEDKGQTIEEFINKTAALKQLVQKYKNRYHVFNNKIKDSEQVKNLMIKVIRNILKSAPHLRRIIPPNTEKTQTSISSSRNPQKTRRIVLLGKSGHGKSASGNTILGAKPFKSALSMSSVTRKSEMHQACVEDWNVSVVDTPGLCDTNMDPEELATEIAECISLSSPGPHAFLIVLPLNQRFTHQEKEIIQMIKALFGEEVMKYTTILFTHGDQLEDQNIDDLIRQNKALTEVVAECGGGYQVFNNKDQRNREQVTALLQKIDRVVEENGGTYYTNQMFQDAASKDMKKYIKYILYGLGAVLCVGAGIAGIFAVCGAAGGAAAGAAAGAAGGAATGGVGVTAAGGVCAAATAVGGVAAGAAAGGVGAAAAAGGVGAAATAAGGVAAGATAAAAAGGVSAAATAAGGVAAGATAAAASGGVGAAATAVGGVAVGATTGAAGVAMLRLASLL